MFCLYGLPHPFGSLKRLEVERRREVTSELPAVPVIEVTHSESCGTEVPAKVHGKTFIWELLSAFFLQLIEELVELPF